MNKTSFLPLENTPELIDRIRNGKLFIYPTDTALGLGATIEDASAVKKLFSLKGRSLDRTVPVLTTRKKALELGNFCEVERAAADEFWPGGLTLVVKTKVRGDRAPGIVRDGTLALRVPDHNKLLSVLEDSPPITGTSANYTGDPTPYSYQELDDSLVEVVDFILKDSCGSTRSSTVAEWDRETEEWIIHRKGPVPKHELEGTQS